MKIIVLAGGLSPERDVSLTSGAGICKTLLENGHQAYLLDLYFGLENAPANLEDVFTLPGAGLEIAKNISTKEPDLEALKKSRPDQSDCMAMSEKMVSFRLLLIFLESNIQAATLLAVPCL